MLSLSVRPLLAARGIEYSHAFLVQIGFSPRNADHLLNGPISIKLCHLEELCIVLKCTPNDLLTWMPNNNEAYTDDLPIHQLQNQAPLPILSTLLTSLPYDRLKTLLYEVQQKV